MKECFRKRKIGWMLAWWLTEEVWNGNKSAHYVTRRIRHILVGMKPVWQAVVQPEHQPGGLSPVGLNFWLVVADIEPVSPRDHLPPLTGQILLPHPRPPPVCLEMDTAGVFIAPSTSVLSFLTTSQELLLFAESGAASLWCFRRYSSSAGRPTERKNHSWEEF